MDRWTDGRTDGSDDAQIRMIMVLTFINNGRQRLPTLCLCNQGFTGCLVGSYCDSERSAPAKVIQPRAAVAMTRVCPARVCSWHSEPGVPLASSRGQSFLRGASWTRAQRATEPSCAGRARCPLLAPQPPCRAPPPSGACGAPCVSRKDRAYFFPAPPGPALAGGLHHYANELDGSAPAEAWGGQGGGRRTD